MDQPTASSEVQYAALQTAVALADRGQEAWLRLTGRDRQDWLHRMCTNQVKDLKPGQGCDAYCPNAKGRILFEIAVYVGRDEVYVSLDRFRLTVALAHFDKYIIADDVRLADLTGSVHRLGLAGPKAGELLEALGLAAASAMHPGDHAVLEIKGVPVLAARSNFVGRTGFDLVVPAEQTPQVIAEIQRVSGPVGLVEVGSEALEITRVEAGRAAWGKEITAEVIPNETAQEPRAIHYNKGCYLGQEIVIRIHHQGTPSKFLRGLKIEPQAGATDTWPPVGTQVFKANTPDSPAVGRLTSVVHSPRLGRLALAYLKRGVYDTLPPVELRDAAGHCWNAKAVELPFRTE